MNTKQMLYACLGVELLSALMEKEYRTDSSYDLEDLMNIEITFKFRETLAKIFKKEIGELGFDTSSLTDDDVLQSYCSYTCRLIENRPRTVHKATSFTCPEEAEIGLKWLEEKIRKGESVNPHLNNSTRENKLDGLLFDWGIHHLHLGETFSAPGYVKRTRPVLFAVFRKDNVYFIDIRDHAGWSDKGLLDIVNANWPELLSIYKMKAYVSGKNPD